MIKGDKRKGIENEEVLTETIEQFIYDMSLIDTSNLEKDPPETESKRLSQSYSKGVQEKQLESFFEYIINNFGYYDTLDFVKVLDKDNENEIKSHIFWGYFTDYLKEMRQQIPNGYSSYGRILSKWFGKDYSKLDTREEDGKRIRIYTFPKIEDVENILGLI